MSEDIIEFVLRSYGYNPTKEDINKIKKILKKYWQKINILVYYNYSKDKA